MIEGIATANGKLRELVIWLAWLLCVVLAAFALDQLARYQLREHLRDSATNTLGALTHGDTPWRWSMRSAADVIAGRAFGSSDSEFTREGFHITSQGEPFEVGLVIHGMLDLQRFPRFEGAVQLEHEALLTINLRTHFEQPLCWSAPHTMGASTSNFSIDLGEIAWQCADGSASNPATAAMLRLSFTLPKSASVVIADVRLSPRTALPLNALSTLDAIELPSANDRPALDSSLNTSQHAATKAVWPIYALPDDARVEEMLITRDHIREQSPAALVIVEDDLIQVRAKAAEWTRVTSLPKWPTWLALVIYIALLTWIRFKPSRKPKLRDACELLGAIAVPLLLVLHGWIADNTLLPIQLAMAVSLAFALSLLIGAAPASPTTRTARRGSWLALLSVIIAMAFVWIARDGNMLNKIPDARQIAQYLAWAAIQQFLICVIVADRLGRLLGSERWALLLAALIFALLHTPNAALMQFTFIGGLIWVFNWQRHRGLLPNILAHTACGLLLASQLPIDWLRSAEVSARYFFF